MSISTLSCVCVCVHLKTLLVSKHENISPSGKTKGLRIEFSRSSKVAPFRDTHPETRVVRILEDQRFASFARKPRSLLELPIHQRGWRNRVIPGNRPITFSSPRGDVPRVITQRLLRPCVHFHPSSSSSPLYISLYLRLFHRSSSSLFDHYASLTSEQVRPSTVVEAAERKVTTFLSSSFFLSFRARSKNTSASRK